MGLYVFSLPISLVMIEITYTLSYYHHQIGSMNYYPLFQVRSWNNGVCCMSFSLRWRHNGRDSISNHQPYDCLLNRLFRRRWKKTSKLRVTGLCVGNSPGTGEFPAQMASNAENVSIWWRHHVYSYWQLVNMITVGRCRLSFIFEKQHIGENSMAHL